LIKTFVHYRSSYFDLRHQLVERTTTILKVQNRSQEHTAGTTRNDRINTRKRNHTKRTSRNRPHPKTNQLLAKQHQHRKNNQQQVPTMQFI
jgi:hypothetical protein